MAVFSGKNLKVETPTGTPVLHVQQAEVTEDPELQEYGSSSTSGNRRGVAGLTRVGGSITVALVGSGHTIGNASGPIPGSTTASMSLWEDSTDENTKHLFTTVLWGEATYGVDADSGAIATATIPFISNGTYTRPDRAT